MAKCATFFAGLAALILMAGCESAGWSDNATPDIITPGVSADTRVRTWDNQGKPHERKVESEPAFLYDSEAEKAQK